MKNRILKLVFLIVIATCISRSSIAQISKGYLTLGGSLGANITLDSKSTIGPLSTSDQSTGLAWGCTGLSIPGTQLAVGSGEANTSLIVAGCNEASFPAKICDNLSLGGQTDWFLPSSDELNLMYKNLHTNNQGNFSDSYYWSSTEDGASHAGSLSLISGHAGNGSMPKHLTLYVRAVRAF